MTNEYYALKGLLTEATPEQQAIVMAAKVQTTLMLAEHKELAAVGISLALYEAGVS